MMQEDILTQAHTAILQERERRDYQVEVRTPHRASSMAQIPIPTTLEVYFAETICTVQHEHGIPCRWIDWAFHLSGEWRVVLESDLFRPGMLLEQSVRILLSEFGELQEYIVSHKLSSNLHLATIIGTLKHDPLTPSIQADYRAIQDVITHFDREVWFGAGLQRYIQETTKRGHSLQSGNVEALLFASAGRAMITLTEKETGSTITVITSADDPEPRMGLQSIKGTAEDGIHLLQYMIDLAEKGEMRFTPDKKAWFG